MHLCTIWLQDSTLWLQNELQLLVALLRQEVVVKEVYVETRLQHPADPPNALPVPWLCYEAVSPVQNVQAPFPGGAQLLVHALKYVESLLSP
jgi:hypothetical protein